MYKEISKNGVTTKVNEIGEIFISYITTDGLSCENKIDIFDAETKKRIHPKNINKKMNRDIKIITNIFLEGEDDVEIVHDKDHPEYEICLINLIDLSDRINGVKYEK